MAPRPLPNPQDDPVEYCKFKCHTDTNDPNALSCYLKCIPGPPLGAATSQYPAGSYSWSSANYQPSISASLTTNYAQHAAATPSPSSTSSSTISSSPTAPPLVAPAASSATSSQGDQNHWRPDNGGNGNHGPPPYIFAASIIVPLIILICALTALTTIIRTRRRRRRQAEALARNNANGPEMQDLSSRRGQSEHAYIRPPSTEPPMSLVTSNNNPPSTSHSGSSPSSHNPPPVLLSSTMEGAYFTGLDTADLVSLRSEPGTSHPHFGASGHHDHDGDLSDDEPPPPYRPRSVPPISRETSVRTSRIEREASTRSRTYRASVLSCGTAGCPPAAGEEEGLRNPFEDPEGEDEDVFADDATFAEGSGSAAAAGGASSSSSSAAAAVGGLNVRRDEDQLSEVSDLSYQRDPVQGRSSL